MTQTADAVDEATGASEALRRGIADGSLTEIEVAWSDPFGHAAGKRIPAAQFLDRALGGGFAFCEAALGWNTDGTVIDTLRLTNWGGGYPDVFAVPDFSTFARLPWRPGVGHVISDIVTHHRTPSLLDPRAVLRRVLDRLAGLGYTDALAAADDSARLKYAAKQVARRHGKLASFMPKPFSEHSGSAAHLHISLWQDGEPAFAAVDGSESELALYAIAGLVEHLPSITLFGAHSVNAYRRFAPDTFAPDTVNWSRDNRSAAVRSLVEEAPEASRIELRSGASDSNPYWLIASALAAVIAGLEAHRLPPEAATGNLYGRGTPLPDSLGTALALATQDDTILDILGADSVLDFAAIARSEWQLYIGHVSDWERRR